MKVLGTHRWPKVLPELTPEQTLVRDDFMRYWHEKLASKRVFVPLERFNHGYAVRHAPSGFSSTLEIGAGLGEHLAYENLTDEQRRKYVALELRQNMVDRLAERFPDIQAHKGDCQSRLDFEDGSFDRILAIHVLEHLPNLPAAVEEMHRLCNKQTGVFSIVIPCEGGLAYEMARTVSTAQMFRRRYKQSYKWFIEQEHLSTPDEIIAVLTDYFEITHRQYFPFLIPSTQLNLCLGLTLKPRANIEPIVGDSNMNQVDLIGSK